MPLCRLSCTHTTHAGSHPDGSKDLVHLQEVASFDPAEGPKSHVGQRGVTVAVLHLRVEPRAQARSKRLSRETSVKVCWVGAGWGRGSGGYQPHLAVLPTGFKRIAEPLRVELKHT